MDLFTKVCLFFTGFYPIIIILAVGYLFINRKLFGEVIIIIAFTLILNRFLKSIFQVPLPPTVGHNGWAFPSGHMHLAFAFWGWIAWNYRYKWVWVTIGIFLTGVGVGLVYRGYHYPSDVLGAIVFAGLSLIGFYYFFKSRWMKQHIGYSFILLMGIGLVLISCIPNVLTMSPPFLGLGILVGAYFGWCIRFVTRISALEEISKNLRQGIFNLIGLAIGAIPLLWVGSLIKEDVNEVVFQFLFGLLLTVWLTGGGLLLAYFLQKKCFKKSIL